MNREEALTVLDAKLDEWGLEGWELVSVVNFSESGTTSKTDFWFKRRR